MNIITLYDMNLKLRRIKDKYNFSAKKNYMLDTKLFYKKLNYSVIIKTILE